MKGEDNPIDPIFWDAITTLLYNDKEQETETTSHPVQMRKESKATYVSAGLFKQH